ncbi:MAG: metallophosphoesterase, partial [Actinobacteria bacterium]|nr:metallophosphoesterase [Actinomycetota bacterium]
MRRLGALAGAGLAWGLAEAARPTLRDLEVEVPRLPKELDGLRIAHLSDFHFGVPSPGIGATWQAAAWVRERQPDFVAVTGDLLTHPRGEPMLRRLVRVLPQPTFAVLGNHDV